jgi:pyruvate kinase
MLYRGVQPVGFDVVPGDSAPLHDRVFAMLLDLRLVEEGDLVILTKGELTGVQGGTNSLQIVQVRRP